MSNHDRYLGSLISKVEYRPEYPNRAFASKDKACEWVAPLVGWYNHQERYRGIKFVTPQQHHNGHAIEICL
jgi:putative transposase